MIRIIKLFYLLLIIFLFVSCTSQSDAPNNVSLELSCVREYTNDSYPGLCGQYTDKNNNGICDLSE